MTRLTEITKCFSVSTQLKLVFEEAPRAIAALDGIDSRERAAQTLEKVPDDEVHHMVELNAREFYDFPRAA